MVLGLNNNNTNCVINSTSLLDITSTLTDLMVVSRQVVEIPL